MPVNNELDCQNAILKFIESGCHKVIITLGSRGAMCGSAEDKRPFFVKTKEVKAVDTTVRFDHHFFMISHVN